MTPSANIKTTLTVKVTFTNSTLQLSFTPRQRCQKIVLMTHKYRGCIAVLSINKSVEPNEEQKVLTSGFVLGITVNSSKHVFSSFWYQQNNKVRVNKRRQ